MRWILPGLLMLALSAPAARADGRPWVELSGGWGAYRMEDVNHVVDVINDAYAPLQMNHVRGGPGFGGVLGLEFDDRWSFGGGYDRLFAKAEIGDNTGGIEHDYGANVFRGVLGRRFAGVAPLALDLAGSLGVVMSDTKFTVTDVGFPPDIAHVKGHGLYADAEIGTDVWIADNVRLVGGVGWRFAVIRETRIGQQILFNSDGSKFELDYGGFVARLGFRVLSL